LVRFLWTSKENEQSIYKTPKYEISRLHFDTSTALRQAQCDSSVQASSV